MSKRDYEGLPTLAKAGRTREGVCTANLYQENSSHIPHQCLPNKLNVFQCLFPDFAFEISFKVLSYCIRVTPPGNLANKIWWGSDSIDCWGKSSPWAHLSSEMTGAQTKIVGPSVWVRQHPRNADQLHQLTVSVVSNYTDIITFSIWVFLYVTKKKRCSKCCSPFSLCISPWRGSGTSSDTLPVPFVIPSFGTLRGAQLQPWDRGAGWPTCGKWAVSGSQA